METIDIRTIDDIKLLQHKLLTQEDFKIGQIQAICHPIKLIGGRFDDYDTRYIDADIANIVTSYQKNYHRFVDFIQKDFGVNIQHDCKLIKFKVEQGSVNLIPDILQEILEVVKLMDSRDLMYVVIVSITAFLVGYCFKQYMDKEKEKLKQETERAKLDNDNRKFQMLETYMQKIDNLANSIVLQKVSNGYKSVIAHTLNNGEQAVLHDVPITEYDKDKFNIISPAVNDIEETNEKYARIVAYNFSTKCFKLEGIGEEVNSDLITPQERMGLIEKAEKQECVTFRLKLFKDGITKRNKKIYILGIGSEKQNNKNETMNV